jgi:Fe2+ or Zn2+ uptake regulation protein
MNKTTLNEVVAKCKNDTKNALQTVYDALNQGQQKKIVKDEAVKALFDLYGVKYTT